MIRVQGSLPAEKAVDLVDARLLTFGLNRKKDIIGVVTDGAAVMQKFGRLLGIEHQQCHAHGIHLAVTDVLYKIQRGADEGYNGNTMNLIATRKEGKKRMTKSMTEDLSQSLRSLLPSSMIRSMN